MGTASSIIRSKSRFYKYGSEYFEHQVLPKCLDLLEEIQVSSHPDASRIFDAFVKMDTDGSGSISVAEFHRYFGWKRGAFTERIFDLYKDGRKEDLAYEEFLVCVWNYCSYDAHLMAKYIFNIFDIDSLGHLSLEECKAMIRMVCYNQQEYSSDDAIQIINQRCGSDALLHLESFIEMVEADNSIIRPAFDIQSRIIERTTGFSNVGNGKSCWDKRRVERRRKFGGNELPNIEFKEMSISSSVNLRKNESNGELRPEFVELLFQRVDRNIDAPEGFDTRLPEERYVDKLRFSLSEVESTMALHDYTIDTVDEVKALREKMWSLIEEIKVAHVDALEAERQRDLGIFERTAESMSFHVDGKLLALIEKMKSNSSDGATKNQDERQNITCSTKEETNDAFDGMIAFFDENWTTFACSFEARFGPAKTSWEKLFDPDHHVPFYFNCRTGERCYNQQNGNQPPAICEVCDNLIDLTDYKCFNCDAPRSERNKKKYRGRISLETLHQESTSFRLVK